MPATTRSRYYRRRFTRRPYKRTYAKRFAYSSRRLNRAFRGNRMQRGEMKYNDEEVTGLTLGYDTDTKLLMNGITQGVGVQERVGKKIMVKGIQLGLHFETPATTGVEQSVRVVVVQDKQANAAACGWDDVFDDGTGGNDATSLTDPLKVENRYRFTVLYDKMLKLSVDSAYPRQHSFKVFRKVNIPVMYGGVGDTIASINSNSIYLLVKNSVVTGNASALIGGYTRIRYTDM